MVTIRCYPNAQDLDQGVTFENIQAIFWDKDGTLSRSEAYLVPLGTARATALDQRRSGLEEAVLKLFGFERHGGAWHLNPTGLLAVGSGEENRLAAAGLLALEGLPWFDCLRLSAEAFEQAERSLPPFQTITPLIEGTATAFHHLAQLPVQLAVVSGDTTANIDTFLSHHHLQSCVALTRGADIPPRKPDPQVFWQVCDQLRVSPDQVVMVGDATGDMAMARSAGAAGCIGVQWGWTLPHPIEQADVILQTWSQLEVF